MNSRKHVDFKNEFENGNNKMMKEPDNSLRLLSDGRGKGKTTVKSKTRSSRAGLQFPVGRIHR